MSSGRQRKRTARLIAGGLLGVALLSGAAWAKSSRVESLSPETPVSAIVLPSALWVGAEPAMLTMTSAGLWCIGYRRRPQSGRDETRR